MIQIDRDRVTVPLVLASPEADHARKRAEEFFSRPYKERVQERFPWNWRLLGGVRDALLDLFHGKCAYCESPVGGSTPLDVDHFRPRERAINLDGQVDPDHYWWLSYEWLNLYPSCPVCNRMKGSRFPVDGPRAVPQSGPEALRQEGRQLLDPCQDDPADHLVFSEDGTVASDSRMGRITIEVLGLNRLDLVEARRSAWERLHHTLESLEEALQAGALPPAGATDRLSVEDLTDPQEPYAGMRRQFVAQWLQTLPAEQTQRLEEHEPAAAVARAARAEKKIWSEVEQRETVKSFQAYQKGIESYSLESKADEEGYFLKTRLIERIEIENFRVMDELTIELGSRMSEVPWLMLLGENGTGKSSVLQAVALTLAGDKYRSELEPLVCPGDVVRHGCEEGEVRVFVSGVADPFVLRFGEGVEAFEAWPPEPKLLVLGYGATRLLPHGPATPRPGVPYARLDNLFDPFVPLEDAEQWLLDLPDDEFPEIARALQSLFPAEDETKLVRHFGERPRVEAEIRGDAVPIQHLSDGYQSVLALAADVAAVMLNRWPAMEAAEGMVLLDEIGAHLHPRWKMRIVSSLREVFPRVQFLATTHNPLCLRGLRDGEVMVMRRHAQGIEIVSDLPSIEGLRVDQLLTSEHFGLNSTLDPEVDRKFQVYYELLALRDPSEDQQRQIEELKAELDRYRVLGTTRRERLMLEAVDRQLAQESQYLDPQARQALKEDTQRKVADIWEQALKQSEV